MMAPATAVKPAALHLSGILSSECTRLMPISSYKDQYMALGKYADVSAGAARLCSAKTLDYQEHASEYGVHWNFFLTVAAVSMLMTLLPIPQKFSLAAGWHSAYANCWHCSCAGNNTVRHVLQHDWLH